MTTFDRRLLERPLPGGFGEADLAGLPEPARRHLSAAIAPGTAITRTVALRMRGRIKIRGWLPFRARQVLNPHRGFIWSARVGGLISGSDSYLAGVGAMRWKLAGLITIASGEGADVSRSAAGRLAAEAIWAPTALLPRCGVRWTSTGPDRAEFEYDLDGRPQTVRYQLDGEGRITSLRFDRWGDPDGTGLWGWYPFGGEMTGYRRFGDVLVPAAGRIGWHFGTERWPEGAFFEFAVTGLHPLPAM